MPKKMISIILVVVSILANIYLIWRVNSNTMTIASYDAGISQNNGVGKLESYWTKYIGGSKSSTSYEEKENAEFDSSVSIAILFILDIAVAGALYVLNKKPKPISVEEDEEDFRIPRRGRRHR